MRLLVCAFAVGLGACGAPSRGAAPSGLTPPAAARPAALVPDCFLGRDRCVLQLDLDGDARLDRIETVRDRACAASDDDRPCRQGLWIALAAGPTQVVGAGTPLPPDPAAAAAQEPLALERDLGALTFLALTHRRPDGGRNWRQVRAAPCAAGALLLSGGDAAFMLCWTAGSARAYHLGY